MNDIHNLQRFIDAQEPKYESVVQELRNGMKRGHWMWYIFPQLAGLGMSSTSQTYAIKSLDEATMYHDHAVLGSRLQTCTRLVIDVKGRTTKEIFGYTDNLKFRSSMTLFDCATNDNLFRDALVKYFNGEADPRTLEILKPTAD